MGGHMITDPPPGQTPDGEVATAIVAALIAADLVAPAKKDAVISQIITGKMKSADWKLLIELAPPAADEGAE